MKEKNVKLWSKNFIIIIIVNFLVFLKISKINVIAIQIIPAFPSEVINLTIGVCHAFLRCIGYMPSVCRLDA